MDDELSKENVENEDVDIEAGKCLDFIGERWMKGVDGTNSRLAST